MNPVKAKTYQNRPLQIKRPSEIKPLVTKSPVTAPHAQTENASYGNTHDVSVHDAQAATTAAAPMASAKSTTHAGHGFGWHKAFELAQNVRFTRTREIDLIERRMQSDPEFAAEWKAQEEEQKRAREDAAKEMTMHAEKIEIAEENQVAAAEHMDVALNAFQEVETLLKSTFEATLQTAMADVEMAAIAPMVEAALPKVAPIEVANESVAKAPLYLSDSAFFEFEPFQIDREMVAPSHVVMVQEAEKPREMKQPEGSITDLFRVLECRFSHANRSSPEANDAVEANGAVEAIAESSAPVVAENSEAAKSHDHGPLVEDIIPETALDFIAKSDETAFDHHDEGEEADDALALAPVEDDDVIDVIEDLADESDDFDDADFDDEDETAIDELLADDAANALDLVEEDADEAQDVAMSDSDSAETQNEAVKSEETKSIVAPRFQSADTSLKPLQKIVPAGPYEFPAIDLLQEPVYREDAVVSQEMLERSAGLLESVLEDFGIRGEIIQVRPGPVVTLYEFEPAAGVKSSRVIGLSDDIARSMSAVSARVAVIPGRNVIGIELPNATREIVYLREIIQSKTLRETSFKLALALGKNIGGEPVVAELAKMPHLLVAGTTGSGKSVAINTMILSLIYRMTPAECRLIMVDPKMLELSVYDGIPHLLTPVVTDPKKAVTALKWAVREMEDRYRKMAKLGVRNIDGFNGRVKEASAAGESITCTVQAGFDRDTGELLYREEEMDLTPLPYIVVIIDEMADLMMVAGKEIESAVQRLAQMARAAGIHLIMATQRPSVDVITGTIKANFPTRISFQVTSKIDSRTILGEQGAETLLGQGDMLHMSGGGRIERVHGAFVSDHEVEAIVSHLKLQGTPDYLATVTDGENDEENDDSVAEIVAAAAASGAEDGEELYVQAVKVVMRDKKCSTSYIQRRLGIGYNKAASLVERMEEEGLVGAANHVGKREILVNQHHN